MLDEERPAGGVDEANAAPWERRGIVIHRESTQATGGVGVGQDEDERRFHACFHFERHGDRFSFGILADECDHVKLAVLGCHEGTRIVKVGLPRILRFACEI
jgi:hypothetical protein